MKETMKDIILNASADMIERKRKCGRRVFGEYRLRKRLGKAELRLYLIRIHTQYGICGQRERRTRIINGKIERAAFKRAQTFAACVGKKVLFV